MLTAAATCAELLPGNAVSIDGQSGEWDSGSRSLPFVMRDADGTYRMYYSAGPRAEMGESAWYPWNIGLATSKDGVAWSYRTDAREPVLYSTPFREGDILNPDEIAARFDSVSATAACVIKDGSVYKMWYTGWAGEQESDRDGITTKLNYRIGYATSPDGVNWTKLPGKAGAGSVVGLGRPGEPDAKGASQPWVIPIASLPEKNARKTGWVMWYEGFDGRTWRICRAESADGVNWKKRGVVLAPGGRGSPDQLGTRGPVVIKRKDRFELWYCGEGVSEPRYRILRAVSKDGVTWTKLLGELELHAGSPLGPCERIVVRSVIAEPDGSCRVFFARETLTTRAVALGQAVMSRWSMYTEVVNP